MCRANRSGVEKALLDKIHIDIRPKGVIGLLKHVVVCVSACDKE
tara:strand:+ start:437 stop:568 length:132 start_codon:yes stop_codon:yes gene_type:complete